MAQERIQAAQQEADEAAAAMVMEQQAIDFMKTIVILLKANGILQRCKPEVIRVFEEMLGDDGSLDSIPAYIINFLSPVWKAFEQALSDYQGQKASLQKFFEWHVVWHKSAGRMLLSEMVQASNGNVSVDAAAYLMRYAFKVYEQRFMPVTATEQFQFPGFTQLPQMVREKVSYCAGYSVYKVVMRQVKRKNQDGLLVQVLDGIQHTRKQDALDAVSKDPTYAANMKYTLQRCIGEVGCSGLRYPKSPMLAVFFLIEEMAAWFFAAKRLQPASFTMLQHAVRSCPAVKKAWYGGLHELSFTGVIIPNDASADHEAMPADAIEYDPQFGQAFELLSSQYLRIWLRESMHKFQEGVQLAKKDSLRTVLKNYKTKPNPKKSDLAGSSVDEDEPPAYQEMPEPSMSFD